MRENFGNAIKNLRIKYKLTQKAFADKFFITEKAISNYETGKRLPDLEFISLICKEFNLSLDYFIQKQEHESNSADLVVTMKNNKYAIFDKGQSTYLTAHDYDGILLSACGNHIVYKTNNIPHGPITYSAVVNNNGEIKEFPNLVLGFNGGFNNGVCPALSKISGLVHLVDSNGEILSNGYDRIKPIDSECNLGLYYGLKFKMNGEVKKRVLINKNGEEIKLHFEDINAPWGDCKLLELTNINLVIQTIKEFGPNIIKLTPDDIFNYGENYPKIISAVNEHSVLNTGTSSEVLYATKILGQLINKFNPTKIIGEKVYPSNIFGMNKIEENFIRKQIDILFDML